MRQCFKVLCPCLIKLYNKYVIKIVLILILIYFFYADHLFIRPYPMGRRICDRLQRSGLVEFYRSSRPSGQVEQTQVTIVFRYAIAGKQERLGPFQVNARRR